MNHPLPRAFGPILAITSSHAYTAAIRSCGRTCGWPVRQRRFGLTSLLLLALLTILPAITLTNAFANPPVSSARSEPAARPDKSATSDKTDLLQTILTEIQRTPISDQPFIERRLSPLYNRPTESRGVLNFRPPTTLEKRTRTPVPETLTIDADTISLLDGQGKGKTLKLTDEPVLQAYTTSLRALLAGDAKPLRRYFEVQVQGSAQRWQVLLKPTDATLRKLIRQIQVQGKSGMIQLIETEEAQGDTVELTLLPRP